jgi:S1-C subfamily serine protease
MIKKKKSAYHLALQHHRNSTKPKPPSKFLWILEVIFVSLVVFIVLSIVLILYLAATNHRKAQDALKSITTIVQTQPAEDDYKKIDSQLGFELTVNTKLQDAEGIINNGDTKDIKTGADVFTPASYSTVNIYKHFNNTATEQAETLGLIRATYVSVTTSSKKTIFDELKAKFGQGSEIELAEKFFAPISDQNLSYKLMSSEEININGNMFRKNIYEVTHNDSFKYKTKQTDYITVQNNRPYKATLYENVGSRSEDLPSFEAVINSLKFSPLGSGAKLSKLGVGAHSAIDKGNSILNGFVANAAIKTISSDPEIQVVAKNQPAVVRIAAAYCPDFELKLGSVIQNFTGGCSANFGSGFIISPDGYIGTNGHVVRSTAVEVLTTSIAVGNMTIIKSYLGFLIKAGLINQATADVYSTRAASGDKSVLKSILGSLSDPNLDAVQIRETKQDGVYAIQLSKEAVKFDLKNLKNFNYGSNIVKAKLIDSDYDPYADVEKDGFYTSDVALLKLESGSNYPYNTLGSIQGLSQGSTLTVIGFPGAAENYLVNQSESLPTPTKGTVSAIRTANGTDNKLIQSDVSIAKGNSGGPAYNEAGEVVGIATYGVTDSKSGGTQFNYMRDIADLKALITKNNIEINNTITGSEKLWEDGLEKFSKAYYTGAISDFNKLKAQYPPHRLVDEFIARAEEAKKQGKEAIPPEVYYTILVVVAVVIIIPAIVLFVVIRRHHRRREIHEAYIQIANNNQIGAQVSPAVTQSVNNQYSPSINSRPRSVDMLSGAPPVASQQLTTGVVPAETDEKNNQSPTPPVAG